jgi:hypothetical protein
MFQYQLEIRGGGRARTIRFTQQQMPEELAAVIRALMQHAKLEP